MGEEEREDRRKVAQQLPVVHDSCTLPKTGKEKEKRERKEKRGRHDPHLVEGRRHLGVNELEEQGPERLDLAATGHVDTAGAKWGHKTEVGSCQREHREEKALMGPVHVGGDWE